MGRQHNTKMFCLFFQYCGIIFTTLGYSSYLNSIIKFFRNLFTAVIIVSSLKFAQNGWSERVKKTENRVHYKTLELFYLMFFMLNEQK